MREVREYRPEDLERVDALRQEAFRHPMRPAAFARGGGRVLLEDGEIMAVLLLAEMAQFFGGRSVRSSGVTSVMVDPRARGKGLVSHLLRTTLAEQRDAGLPIAILYPSLISAYRRAGFEFAGVTQTYRIPVASLPANGDIAALEPWGEEQFAEVEACYRTYAVTQNGMVDRPRYWWDERVVDPLTMRSTYRYLVRREGRVTGYVIYSQEPDPAQHGYAFAIRVRDLVWLDAHAAQAILAFLAANRPFGVHVTWEGPVDEPLGDFFNYDEMKCVERYRWMLRLIDLPAALAARGYPHLVAGSVAFEVSDAVLPDNAGAWRLEVADGAGQLVRIPRATAQLDITTLAALSTGWLPARDAARAGRLRNATAHEIATLELLFHGPKPWLPEAF